MIEDKPLDKCAYLIYDRLVKRNATTLRPMFARTNLEKDLVR